MFGWFKKKEETPAAQPQEPQNHYVPLAQIIRQVEYKKYRECGPLQPYNETITATIGKATIEVHYYWGRIETVTVNDLDGSRSYTQAEIESML